MRISYCYILKSRVCCLQIIFLKAKVLNNREQNNVKPMLFRDVGTDFRPAIWPIVNIKAFKMFTRYPLLYLFGELTGLACSGIPTISQTVYDFSEHLIGCNSAFPSTNWICLAHLHLEDWQGLFSIQLGIENSFFLSESYNHFFWFGWFLFIVG